jgi:GT2 family glycosyltransferase
MLDASVIIINYKTTCHLKNCLNSILLHSKEIDYEILVADNNSEDVEIEKLFTQYPTIKFFMRDVNDGFGAGCNFAVKKARGKYFLFVNPDVIFNDNSIKKFFDFIERNPEVALCSGIQVDENNKPQYSFNNFPNIGWEFREAISRTTDKKIQQLLDEKLSDKSIKEAKVDWVIGACMFVRSDLFKKIGGFDENLFLYYEDVDLQYRLIKLGYKIKILTEVRIYHYQRSSVRSEEGKDVYYYNMHKSKMKYMQKHFNFFKRNLVRLMFITGMILRLITIPIRKEKSAYTSKQVLSVLKIYLNKPIDKE